MLLRFVKNYYKTFLVIILMVLLLSQTGGSVSYTFVNQHGINFIEMFSVYTNDYFDTINNINSWFDSWYIDPRKWYAFLNMFNMSMRMICTICMYLFEGFVVIFNILSNLLMGWDTMSYNSASNTFGLCSDLMFTFGGVL